MGKLNDLLYSLISTVNGKSDNTHTHKLSELTQDSTHRVVTDSEKTAWNAKSNFSGSYNDLTNKPTILTKAEIEALIKTMVLDGYLGGKQIRYVDNASDTGKTGYLTIKKG